MSVIGNKHLREHMSCYRVIRGMKYILASIITISVLKSLATKVYPAIWEHCLQSNNLETEDNHVHQIIKEFRRLYVKMIAQHHTRLLTDKFINYDKGIVFRKLTKTVLFLHQ
ncbi:hypothetical protein ElyMa_001909200 [Elysia marginata]|uniref:Uncharacterized protein n=1 Tax=Elysia marginata TaxID=1093978 RepID=A0AAV4ETW2_9GAST|nr:hypothetical protein ElyMa_001909200 [Elysia marginata]